MLSKPSYKIAGIFFVVALLGVGTFFYLKKKKAEKQAAEKAAPKKTTNKDLTKNAPAPQTTSAQAKNLEVAGGENQDQPI
ncbi:MULTISPECIES: hypothetical protein [unclassified Aureispira]|uniref:hypothetical protein n=1 Tax=unclassified Aureispira TaxID=2649989 RepID=UPI0006982B53|nr:MULTISPECIES: hypothetical protein [unclassified Aureispira]WMX17040.1 hypothetical protein QP953_11720 [Aureispira sp. CCB-E]WMX17140.1 hypothetical protein QP953_12220 [Aureispira sp. CCB-E]